MLTVPQPSSGQTDYLRRLSGATRTATPYSQTATTLYNRYNQPQPTAVRPMPYDPRRGMPEQTQLSGNPGQPQLFGNPESFGSNFPTQPGFAFPGQQGNSNMGQQPGQEQNRGYGQLVSGYMQDRTGGFGGQDNRLAWIMELQRKLREMYGTQGHQPFGGLFNQLA